MKFMWFGPAGAQTIYRADATFENGVTTSAPLFEGWLEPGKTVLGLPDDHPQALVWKDRGWLKPDGEMKDAAEPADAKAVDAKAVDAKAVDAKSSKGAA